MYFVVLYLIDFNVKKAVLNKNTTPLDWCSVPLTFLNLCILTFKNWVYNFVSDMVLIGTCHFAKRQL